MRNEADKTKESTAPRNYFLWLRTILGVCILGVVLAWVISRGALAARLSLRALIWSTLISLLTCALQASTLISMARAFQRKLNTRSALRITSLSSLGNAAGGLPLGTTVKYTILYRKVGMSLAQITFGLSAYTIGITLTLLGYAVVGILALHFQPLIKTLSVAILLGGIAVIPLIARFWARRSRSFSELIGPFLKKPTSVMVACISFATASLFTLNSAVVGLFLFPEHSFFHIWFISASGILLGLGSLLQSVGGIQEIAMGIAAYASGIQTIDGVQIALVMRFTSIISSGLILGVSYLVPERSPANRRH